MPEKLCLSCNEIKHVLEFSKDAQKSDGLRRYCRVCMNSAHKARYASNRSKVSKIAATRYAQNREGYLARSRAYYVDNASSKLAQNKAWKQRNRHKNNLYGAARRALKLKATPEWGIDFFIEEAYALAKLRSDIFGVRWEVDHIVPLVSKKVCGLHVHCNLQVIMRSENARKSNTFWPGM